MLLFRRAYSRAMHAEDQTASGDADKRKLLFCTYEHCQEGLNFKPGRWNKQCSSQGKFWNGKKAGLSPHNCGAPANGSTYSYVWRRDALAQPGWKFVDRNSQEGIRALEKTSYNRNSHLVWIPANTTLVPHVPDKGISHKHKRELQEEQSSQPASKKQVCFAGVFSAPRFPHADCLYQRVISLNHRL